MPVSLDQAKGLNDPLIGTTIDGRYLIEIKLGEGGMGIVYAARHVIIDKSVAIKVLKIDTQDDPTAGLRFIQEAKSASKIEHANIVDITDFGLTSSGAAYFVMEYLQGQTLSDLIRQGPLDPIRVIFFSAQIARGLNAAHKKGIVHRDLKPENIFILQRDGGPEHIKIVDFGIAKVQEGGPLGGAGQRLTQVGMVLGTPEYMSPEQATGKETDYRVDEYALGCIMYEMLTGVVPFHADSSAGTLTKQVFEPLVPPRKRCPELNIPLVLDALVCKTMAKNPNDRFPGMLEILEALDEAAVEIDSGRDREKQSILNTEAGRMTAPVSPLDIEDMPRHRGGTWLLLAVIATVLVGAFLWALLQNRQPTNHVAATPSTAAPQIAPHVEADFKPIQPPAAPITQIQLTLRSSPLKASIFREGKLLGYSPQSVELAATSTPIEFIFRKKGFEDHSESIIPNRNREITISLIPALRQHAPAHRPNKVKTSIPKKRVRVNDLVDPFGESAR